MRCGFEQSPADCLMDRVTGSDTWAIDCGANGHRSASIQVGPQCCWHRVVQGRGSIGDLAQLDYQRRTATAAALQGPPGAGDGGE